MTFCIKKELFWFPCSVFSHQSVCEHNELAEGRPKGARWQTSLRQAQGLSSQPNKVPKSNSCSIDVIASFKRMMATDTREHVSQLRHPIKSDRLFLPQRNAGFLSLFKARRWEPSAIDPGRRSGGRGWPVGVLRWLTGFPGPQCPYGQAWWG